MASLMDGLAQDLNILENKVANVSGRFETINRELEKAVIALAHRINSMESGGAQ
jgi:UDP-N-acetylmuramyl tripeptide synthase